MIFTLLFDIEDVNLEVGRIKKLVRYHKLRQKFIIYIQTSNQIHFSWYLSRHPSYRAKIEGLHHFRMLQIVMTQNVQTADIPNSEVFMLRIAAPKF